MNFAFFRMNNNEDEVFQLTHNRRMQIQTYRNFSEQTALHYWCCVCLKNLYPEEVHYNKNLRIDNNLPAYRWGYTAQTNAKGHAVTCRSHKETSIIKDTEFIFPGKELEITKQLNYRELSMLSPIKLMSKMTRKKSGFHGRLGHYELSGDVYIKFNYEFASMLYQGSSSLFFIDNANRLAINMQVVRAAWKELTDQNPLLKQYRLPHIESALVKHHVSTYPERVGLRDNTHGEYSDYINRDNNWENKMARPLADGTAGIAEDGEEFLRLLIGSDTNNIKVTYSHPLLLCLLFPYLFTNGKGFYSLKKRSEKLFQHSYIPKETDLASYNNITLREFSKMLLLGKDRRFAKDPSFIFILLDIIEKQTIFSYNRRVIQLYGTTNYKAKDIRVFDVNRVLNTKLPLIAKNLGKILFFFPFTLNENSNIFSTGAS
ncbi:hypothetical protein BD408DRAFT_125582 [Parasitella parasitica]|nr:hypothetical protein BD408DRAFT_125582 [Parasitella parasitica]